MSTRPKLVRVLAARLAADSGINVDVDHDNGTLWRMNWQDGPTYDEMRALVAAADVGGAELRLSRTFTRTAYALTAIRRVADGSLTGRTRDPERLVESALRETSQPQRPADEREAAMLARLLAAAPAGSWNEEALVCRMVAESGLGWLRDDDGAEPAPLTAIELLTDRYAEGEDRQAWKRRMVTMPVRGAVLAAAADPQLDAEAAAALLELLPVLRAELDAIEATAGAVLERGTSTVGS